MPTMNSITRTIRFCPSDVEKIEDLMGKEGCTFNAAVHLLVSDGDVPDKAVCVPQNKEKETGGTLAESACLRDIEQMVTISGLTMGGFFSQIDDLLNDGTIDVSGGKVAIVYPSWATQFEETCHDLCIPVEKAAESAVKALKKGVI